MQRIVASSELKRGQECAVSRPVDHPSGKAPDWWKRRWLSHAFLGDCHKIGVVHQTTTYGIRLSLAHGRSA